MLINLIEFGGIIFWVIIAFLSIFAFFASESNDADAACPFLFIVSLLVVYGLSNAPMIDLKFIAGYFGIGVAWSLALFHFKLLKVRNWLRGCKLRQFKKWYKIIHNDGIRYSIKEYDKMIDDFIKQQKTQTT